MYKVGLGEVVSEYMQLSNTQLLSGMDESLHTDVIEENGVQSIW